MVQGRHVLDVMSVVLLMGWRTVGGRFSSLVLTVVVVGYTCWNWWSRSGLSRSILEYWLMGGTTTVALCVGGGVMMSEVMCTKSKRTCTFLSVEKLKWRNLLSAVYLDVWPLVCSTRGNRWLVIGRLECPALWKWTRHTWCPQRNSMIWLDRWCNRSIDQPNHAYVKYKHPLYSNGLTGHVGDFLPHLLTESFHKIVLSIDAQRSFCVRNNIVSFYKNWVT